jgi:hypothetical protein
MTVRVAIPADLVVLKLAAAEEPQRRARKRRQDFLDILTLVEDHPEAARAVPDLKERLERLRSVVLTIP